MTLSVSIVKFEQLNAGRENLTFASLRFTDNDAEKLF